MNKTYLGLAAVCLFAFALPAGSVNEFEQWMQQQQQSFQQYRDERDREFTAFLKEHWREVEMLKGFVRDEKPKPVVVPVAEPEPLPDTSRLDEPVDKPVEDQPLVVVQPQPDPEPVAPLRTEPVPAVERKGLRARVDYFGTNITFYYDPGFRRSLPYRLNEKALSNFWSELSKADYEQLGSQLDNQARALALNDWGYVLLVDRLAREIYPSSENKQALFTWFMLAKAGFGSRVAYDDRRVYLLVPSRQQLYDVTYFTFDGQRYYAVSLDGGASKPGRVYTYDGHYPDATRALDLSIRTRAPKGEGAEKRSLVFDFGGKQYSVEAQYEQARIDFLDTYPQLDLKVYFESEVGAAAESPLLQMLAREMQGMSEQEAVNFLLRFVQTSFRYKRDEKQFGRENYLFPEETIFYGYSDCEDRSVFFAWLVRSLLDLDVIGLNYPGHVATAVYLSTDAPGDHVTYKGKRYSVADPTYINASLGMTMPEYANTRPDVIAFN